MNRKIRIVAAIALIAPLAGAYASQGTDQPALSQAAAQGQIMQEQAKKQAAETQLDWDAVAVVLKTKRGIDLKKDVVAKSYEGDANLAGAGYYTLVKMYEIETRSGFCEIMVHRFKDGDGQQVRLAEIAECYPWNSGTQGGK